MNRDVINSFFKVHSFIESDIHSFNTFIDKGMQEIVKEIGDIIPTVIPKDMQDFRIKLDKIWVEKPQLVEADGSKRDIFPMEARLRSITYSAPIWLEVSAHIDGVQRESFQTQIGKIPIMTKSKYCHLYGMKREELITHGEDPDDFGGYFILNGNERVLITVEDLASNTLFVERSSGTVSKWVGKLFSEKGAYRVPHVIEQMKDGIINLSFTRFSRLPVMAVIKALGVIKDEEIYQLISEDREYDDLYVNLYITSTMKTDKHALEFISKKIGLTQVDPEFEKMKDNLDKYLLPHLGTLPKDRITKAINLCKLVKKFLLISKEGLEVDKDHYLNKRLKLSGDLLGDLFRVNLRALINDLVYNFQRLVKRGKFTSLKIIIRDKLLTSRLKSAMATGTWVGGRKGISQNLDRTNFLATISHLQRVVSLLSATQENFAARALHPTHYGRLCLDKNTNILLADGATTRTLDQLQNCWKHHGVTTYDQSNGKFIESGIVSYFSSNPELMNKKVYRINSDTGRDIIATTDHPFLTQRGWINAGDLEEGENVLVYPMLNSFKTPNPPSIEKGKIVVDESLIKELYPNRFKHYIKLLKGKELLPFTVNNYWAEIIARIQGHIFTDGHCSKYNLEFYCGSLNDAKEIYNDILKLGFKASKISKKVSKSVLNGRNILTTNYRFTIGGALHALLVALDSPVGRKTDLVYKVPSWLNEVELSVKREFLSSYMGGDGGKARYENQNNHKGKVKIEDLFFHKAFDCMGKGIEFANELKNMFGTFGVKVIRITNDYVYTRKDGTKMYKIELVFSRSVANCKNLLTNIGYRYCEAKSKIGLYLGEWLRLHQNVINDKVILKKKIRELYQNGVMPKEISQLVPEVSYRMINSWLYERKYNKTSTSKSDLMSFNQWIENAKFGLENTDLIWNSVVSKEEVQLNDVRDITTKEDTHTFIANGFVTHNCPIETPEGTPIGLRKNRAMLAEITQDKTSFDKVKKLLEGAGLKSK